MISHSYFSAFTWFICNRFIPWIHIRWLCFRFETKAYGMQAGLRYSGNILSLFKRAENFFKKHINDCTVFSCDSRILSPDNRFILPVSSRVRGFADDYLIIKTKDDISNNNLRRIFNTFDFSENYDNFYPQIHLCKGIFRSGLKAGIISERHTVWYSAKTIKSQTKGA